MSRSVPGAGSRKRSTSGASIEAAIAKERWGDARRQIERGLARDPESHWLLSRLALTHYEQRDYAKALEIEKCALALAPDCPLSLWGYAGSLDMLGREQEAADVYERIIARGIESLAHDECGEGLRMARGLYADALYCLARCYDELGDRRKARKLADQALQERGPGCASIYQIREVKEFVAGLRARNVGRPR